MRYEESGRFFINEMRLKRKTLNSLEQDNSIKKRLSNYFEKFVMLAYEKLSLYGELC